MKQDIPPEEDWEAAMLHAVLTDSDTIHVTIEALYAELRRFGLSPAWWNEHMMKTGKKPILCGYNVEIVVRGER